MAPSPAPTGPIGGSTVNDYHFSWGAHLLLWAFPLSLALSAILLFLRDRAARGERR
jgi:hypothetical protein